MYGCATEERRTNSRTGSILVTEIAQRISTASAAASVDFPTHEPPIARTESFRKTQLAVAAAMTSMKSVGEAINQVMRQKSSKQINSERKIGRIVAVKSPVAIRKQVSKSMGEQVQ